MDEVVVSDINVFTHMHLGLAVRSFYGADVIHLEVHGFMQGRDLHVAKKAAESESVLKSATNGDLLSFERTERHNSLGLRLK